MIETAPGRLIVTAPLVMDNACKLLAAGCSALQPGEQVIDLGRVTEADSSALAVMLGWLRAAESLHPKSASCGARSTVKFANIPAGVRSLAELYGITELLPLA
ncbi:MAG: STAS domain-containing protein [Rhodocyclaceae bacterium]|nr:STAS domain-containing protein [Rhodocyclaceae bacterium]